MSILSMKGRNKWGLASLLALSVGVAGCGKQQAAAPKPFAVVNGQALTPADWQIAVSATDMIQGITLPTDAASKKSQESELVQQAAVEQWGLKHGVVTKSQAQKQASQFINQTMAQIFGGSSGLSSQLKSHHLTAAEFDTFVTQQMELQAVFNKETASVQSLPAGTGLSFYKSHSSLFVSPTKAEVRMILVHTDAEAKKLLAEIQKGASFSALAKKYSLDPGSRQQGGSLGYVDLGPQSGFVPQFYKVMDTLKAGQYGIAHTQYGYHVIEVQKIVPGTLQPYSAVKSQVDANLLQNKKDAVFQAFAAKVVAKSHVTRNF